MTEKPHILVADDNVVLQQVLRHKLESAGMKVTTAGDGFEALQALLMHDIDLIVSDYQMPGVGGSELLSALRSDSRYKDLPIIMVTGKADEINMPRLREQYNLHAILSKPLSMNLLLNAAIAALPGDRLPSGSWDEDGSPIIG